MAFSYQDSLVYGLKGATGPLGPAVLNWRGSWDDETQYQVNDAVDWNGSSYVCIQTSLNDFPSDTDFWALVAERGHPGSVGATGPSGGPTGPTGATGPDGATGATGPDNGLPPAPTPTPDVTTLWCLRSDSGGAVYWAEFTLPG